MESICPSPGETVEKYENRLAENGLPTSDSQTSDTFVPVKAVGDSRSRNDEPVVDVQASCNDQSTSDNLHDEVEKNSYRRDATDAKPVEGDKLIKRQSPNGPSILEMLLENGSWSQAGPSHERGEKFQEPPPTAAPEICTLPLHMIKVEPLDEGEIDYIGLDDGDMNSCLVQDQPPEDDEVSNSSDHDAAGNLQFLPVAVKLEAADSDGDSGGELFHQSLVAQIESDLLAPTKPQRKKKSTKAAEKRVAAKQAKLKKRQKQCRQCGKMFDRPSQLKEHKRIIHFGKKPYKCTVCPKKFSLSSDFQRHLRSHSGQRPYKCSLCRKGFESTSDLSIHLLIHTDKCYKCPECSKTFTKKKKLKAHMRDHKKPFKCTECPLSFSRAASLAAHLRGHEAAKKLYRCKICQEVFMGEKFLKRHKRFHKKVKAYECSSCEKAFFSAAGLQRHVYVKHTDPDDCVIISPPADDVIQVEGAIQLDDDAIQLDDDDIQIDDASYNGGEYPPQTFASSSGYELHFDTRSERDDCALISSSSVDGAIQIEQVSYSCSECPRTFGSASGLKRHFRTHSDKDDCTVISGSPVQHDEKAFKCTECPLSFATSGVLKRHLQLHNDNGARNYASLAILSYRDEIDASVKSYKCDKCPKAYHTESKLRTHYRVHTGERPFKCTFCNKGFRQIGTLKAHHNTHTGERPYKCTACPKAFGDGSTLRAHFRLHTGERPYKCTVCEKAFHQINGLNSHLRSHKDHIEMAS